MLPLLLQAHDEPNVRQSFSCLDNLFELLERRFPSRSKRNINRATWEPLEELVVLFTQRQIGCPLELARAPQSWNDLLLCLRLLCHFPVASEPIRQDGPVWKPFKCLQSFTFELAS